MGYRSDVVIVTKIENKELVKLLQEDEEVGSENHYSNEMKLILNNSNSLKYRTRRNKKTDLTEYYNLIYEYKNDCLTAAIQYNKDYYSDKDLKPNEEIFFQHRYK